MPSALVASPSDSSASEETNLVVGWRMPCVSVYFFPSACTCHDCEGRASLSRLFVFLTKPLVEVCGHTQSGLWMDRWEDGRMGSGEHIGCMEVGVGRRVWSLSSFLSTFLSYKSHQTEEKTTALVFLTLLPSSPPLTVTAKWNQACKWLLASTAAAGGTLTVAAAAEADPRHRQQQHRDWPGTNSCLPTTSPSHTPPHTPHSIDRCFLLAFMWFLFFLRGREMSWAGDELDH